MNRPNHLRARLAVMVTGGALVAALFPLAGVALAATTVTPATGGSAISADTAVASPGTNTFATTLIGPVVTEAVAGELAAGTIVLEAPSGFEFKASTGTANKNAGCDLVLASIAVTSTSITLTLTGSSASTACVITFSGIQVHPTVGTPLQGGNISNSGTTGPGGNWGTLTEVAGAPVLSFQTEPSTSAGAGDPHSRSSRWCLDRISFDNPRTSNSITLAIKAGTGASGSAAVVHRQPGLHQRRRPAYTFAACKIRQVLPADPYVLRASPSAGGAAAESGHQRRRPAQPPSSVSRSSRPGASPDSRSPSSQRSPSLDRTTT